MAWNIIICDRPCKTIRTLSHSFHSIYLFSSAARALSSFRLYNGVSRLGSVKLNYCIEGCCTHQGLLEIILDLLARDMGPSCMMRLHLRIAVQTSADLRAFYLSWVVWFLQNINSFSIGWMMTVERTAGWGWIENCCSSLFPFPENFSLILLMNLGIECVMDCECLDARNILSTNGNDFEQWDKRSMSHVGSSKTDAPYFKTEH